MDLERASLARPSRVTVDFVDLVDGVDLVDQSGLKWTQWTWLFIGYWLCSLGLDTEAGSDGFGFAVNSATPLGLKKLAQTD